jgi:bifunctional DNA-binding transcriptional regulator/antitoxin component of YhaV-PrlF toxin-antitoxin module
MKAVISSKGQVALPTTLRRLDQLEAGEVFEIERISCGEYRLTRRAPVANEGLVDLLLACPVNGFFTRVDSASRSAQ